MLLLSETCGICRPPKKEMVRRNEQTDYLDAQEHSKPNLSSLTAQKRREGLVGKDLFVLHTYLTVL